MKSNAKKFMKKSVLFITAAMLAAIMMLSMTACSEQVPLIGINQYGEHPSLDNCREGFLAGLAEAGLEEGKDYVIDYQNAGFDDNIASQIGQNFASKNAKLMVGIATNSATSCYAAAEDKNIPVVFCAVTDPIQAKLDKGNITGTSDKLAIEDQLKLIRALQPDADTIGILYTLSEPNSVSAIAEYEQLAPQYGFTIVKKGVTAQAEVTLAADALIQEKVDCFNNLTDNNVVGVLPSILEKTIEAGIPVYGSEIEQVKIGCIASQGIDYVKLGRQTGAIAAKILKGEATAEELPYETISEYELYINTKAAAEMQVTIPAELLEKAQDVAE